MEKNKENSKLTKFFNSIVWLACLIAVASIFCAVSHVIVGLITGAVGFLLSIVAVLKTKNKENKIFAFFALGFSFVAMLISILGLCGVFN